MTAPAPTTFAAVLRAELTRRRARNPSYLLRAFARAVEVDHATLSQILRGDAQALSDGDALAILDVSEGRPFGVYRSAAGRRP